MAGGKPGRRKKSGSDHSILGSPLVSSESLTDTRITEGHSSVLPPSIPHPSPHPLPKLPKDAILLLTSRGTPSPEKMPDTRYCNRTFFKIMSFGGSRMRDGEETTCRIPKETLWLHLDYKSKCLGCSRGGNAVGAVITVTKTGIVCGAVAVRKPSLRASGFLAGFRARASVSCRFPGGAPERTFGEVAAADRAIGGREENAGPRHLQRDGRQPLQLVAGEHCREVPGEKRPADDDTRGPQGTHGASHFSDSLSPCSLSP